MAATLVPTGAIAVPVQVLRPQRLAVLDQAPDAASGLRKAASQSRGVRIVRGSLSQETASSARMSAGRPISGKLPTVYRHTAAAALASAPPADDSDMPMGEQAQRPRFASALRPATTQLDYGSYAAAWPNILFVSGASPQGLDAGYAGSWLRTRVAIPLAWPVCTDGGCRRPALMTWRRKGSVDARW